MSKSSTLIRVDLFDSALAPNNFYGRLGARLYNHTMEGFGVIMSGIVALCVCLPMIVGGLVEGNSGVAISGFIIAFVYLFFAFATLYARVGAKRHDYASAIAGARKDYRRLDKGNREMAKPLMDKIESAVMAESNEGVRERLSVLVDLVAATDTSSPAHFDNSDITFVREYVEEIRKLNAKYNK